MEANIKAYDNFSNIMEIVFPEAKKMQLNAAYKIKELIRSIDDTSSSSQINYIISLGCGTGEIELFLSLLYPGLNIFACDFSREAIKIAKLNVKDKLKEYKDIVSSKRENIAVNENKKYISPKYFHMGYEKFYEEIIIQNINKNNIDLNNTMLIVLGNTIQQFSDIAKFYNLIDINNNFGRPKYLLIDFLNNWEDIISDKINNEVFLPWKVCNCGGFCKDCEEKICILGYGWERKENEDRVKITNTLSAKRSSDGYPSEIAVFKYSSISEEDIIKENKKRN